MNYAKQKKLNLQINQGNIQHINQEMKKKTIWKFQKGDTVLMDNMATQTKNTSVLFYFV